MLNPRTTHHVINHAHLFCGLGGGARGFNRATARVGNLTAEFRCLGGIDVDTAAVRDFERLAGVTGTRLDLFDREQYRAFHGAEPPADWREAGPADVHRAFGHERPHILFLSPPCKGFSGLLSEANSKSGKYQALNRLTLRGLWLALEAYADDPIELILLENVPRIATRGRALLDRMNAMLRAYGYAVAETSHDCGQLGGLAQSRRRFLMLARHQKKVPPFLYEAPKRSLRAVGDVLGRLTMPGDLRAGPMHRVPSLTWLTWLRLAFVEAGCDWRSLAKLRVVDGQLADYGLMPQANWHNGALGVTPWMDSAGTITGGGRPMQGTFSVADPRRQEGVAAFGQYGVKGWADVSQTVIGKAAVGTGQFSVADPRHSGPAKYNNVYRVVDWSKKAPTVTSSRDVGIADPRPVNNRQFDNIYRLMDWSSPSRTVIGRTQPSDGALSVADPRARDAMFHNAYRTVGWNEPSQAIIGQHSPSNGAMSVADPRAEAGYEGRGKYRVTNWEQPSGTVIGASATGNGTFAVGDPRPGLKRDKGDDWAGAGHYGVTPWSGTSGAVSGAAGYDNGRWSVADPRQPEVSDRLIAVIQSLDGTWHRPFTTLELAALQSLVDPEEHLELEGLSDAGWRERIGNAVPPDAAQAIAETMGCTLLMAWSGEGFKLSSVPIWVQPVAVALSVHQPDIVLDTNL